MGGVAGPDYEVTVFEDRLQQPTDPANRVLLDHPQRIRLPRDEPLSSEREWLEKRQDRPP